MEFEKRKPSGIESLRSFAKNKCNPLSNQPLMIARDTSYPYQRSEDAYVLLVPLLVKQLFIYIQPYVDQRTELTEYCIKVAKIEKEHLTVSGNSQIYTFDGSKIQSTDVRMNKGVRYVQFLADYFDPEKNKILYKVAKNSRGMVAERRSKFDTDKKEYEDKSGFVELQHLRVQNEGELHNYVQILCVKAYKGERQPAKICPILDGEWKFISKYLNFAIRYYKLNDILMSDGIQKKRIDLARREVLEAVGKVSDQKKQKNSTKPNEIEEDREEFGDDGENDAPSSSKKRKTSSKKETTSTNSAKPSEIEEDREEFGDDGENDAPSSSKKRKTSSKKETTSTKPRKSAKKPVRVELDSDSDKENIDPNKTDAASDSVIKGVENEVMKSVRKILEQRKSDEEEEEENKDDEENSDMDNADLENDFIHSQIM